MAHLIKNNGLIEDSWHLLSKEADATVLPLSQATIVPVHFWHAHKMQLKTSKQPLGIWLDADEEIETIVEELSVFSVIALNFPHFMDGRHSSSAYLLRTRYFYTGEVRAIGDVLRDQLFALKRCGFDAFALRADKDPLDALNSFRDFSETYQASADNPAPLFRRRRASQ